MFCVTAHQSVFIFRPCKKRRIVRYMKLNVKRLAGYRACPVWFVFGRDDRRQSCPVIQNGIKISKAFNSGKDFPCVFAEQRHKASVPYPYLCVAERLIHIRILRHSRNAFYMLKSELPCLIVQFNILWMLLANGYRNILFPIRRSKVFPHF